MGKPDSSGDPAASARRALSYSAASVLISAMDMALRTLPSCRWRWRRRLGGAAAAAPSGPSACPASAPACLPPPSCPFTRAFLCCCAPCASPPCAACDVPGTSPPLGPAALSATDSAVTPVAGGAVAAVACRRPLLLLLASHAASSSPSPSLASSPSSSLVELSFPAALPPSTVATPCKEEKMELSVQGKGPDHQKVNVCVQLHRDPPPPTSDVSNSTSSSAALACLFSSHQAPPTL